MSVDIVFTKDNIENYLINLSKEFKKLNGKRMPAEIILIGGAAILLKYNFRKSTNDVDAIIMSSSVMREAVNIVGEKFKLPNEWLNMDFKNTKSYSDKLLGVSKFYKTFSNILEVRIIDSEYLIAMKLMSGRIYKNDLSDIAGILWEHKKNGDEINLDKIKKAAVDLYENWNNIPEKSRDLINKILNNGNYERMYYENRKMEIETKKTLVEFDKKYPGKLKEDNIDDIINNIKIKQEKNLGINDINNHIISNTAKKPVKKKKDPDYGYGR